MKGPLQAPFQALQSSSPTAAHTMDSAHSSSYHPHISCQACSQRLSQFPWPSLAGHTSASNCLNSCSRGGPAPSPEGGGRQDEYEERWRGPLICDSQAGVHIKGPTPELKGGSQILEGNSLTLSAPNFQKTTPAPPNRFKPLTPLHLG